jgi:hypothetical protein
MRAYLVGTVMAAALLAGCGSGNSTPQPAATPTGPWHDGIPAAAAAAKVGGADTPCRLPVAMDVADKWKPKGVDVGVHSEGGADLACEIDGKPAGIIGFVRVWVGDSAEPRQALEAFIADQVKASAVEYRDTAVGQGSGAEVTWINAETGRKRAFAMSTPLRTVVVTTGGLDDEEYLEMLPAFLLAKQSLVPLER